MLLVPWPLTGSLREVTLPLFPLSPDSTAQGPVMFLVLLLTEDPFNFVLLNTLECSKIAEAHTVPALAASQLNREPSRTPSSTSVSTLRLVWRLSPESQDPPGSLSLSSCLNNLPHTPVPATWGLLLAACHFSSIRVLPAT